MFFNVQGNFKNTLPVTECFINKQNVMTLKYEFYLSKTTGPNMVTFKFGRIIYLPIFLTLWSHINTISLGLGYNLM